MKQIRHKYANLILGNNDTPWAQAHEQGLGSSEYVVVGCVKQNY